MPNILKAFLLFPLSFLIACNQDSNITNDNLTAFDVKSLAHHIEILASDSFMGREPFTEGETKTIAYLQ